VRRAVRQPFGKHLLAASQQESFYADKTGMTQMHADDVSLNDLSGAVIGCAFTVLNTLGAGLLDKNYENAMAPELAVVQQPGVKVTYKGSVVGAYFADLVVEDQLLVALKAVKALDAVHRAQCVNYHKATGLHLGLLLDFGKPRPKIRRVANSL
jgi:GxxExxY protein